MPGRCSDSAASMAAPRALGSPTGSTPSSTRRAARRASGVSTTSCPPKTRSPSSGIPASAKSGRMVTMPVGSASPAPTAAAPVSAVVATEPRPPTSHTPTRLLMTWTLHCTTTVASCLSSLHGVPLYAACQDQVCSLPGKTNLSARCVPVLRVPFLALTLTLASACGTDARTSQSSERLRVLVFTKTTGFRHESIPDGVRAIQRLGRTHRMTVDTTGSSSRFTTKVLNRYDAVIFLSATGTPIAKRSQQRAFERYIKAGGGYLGVHAASD